MPDEYETLRWPTNLSRAEIMLRLARVRESANAAGLVGLAGNLANLDQKSASQVGAAVIAAISMVQEKPEYEAIAKQLSLIALNLKNLK